MLDPQGKDEIKKVIRSLHDESGLTILSITHDIDEVAGSDSVLVMDHGKLVQQGTHKKLMEEEGIYRSFISERREAASWKVKRQYV